ncbi:MAG: IS66 family transposase [Actinobacteria bacterium]|nr:IS66 family transposase [Actinomycetota bacterium]MBI3685908.1 IS66 family transposase [Actinomycetota bacterium]
MGAGKQPGAVSVSRRLVDDADAVFEVAPQRCGRCEATLVGAVETARVRRQVVDACAPPPPVVNEYQLVSRRCGCGHVNDPTASDLPRPLNPDPVVVPDPDTGVRAVEPVNPGTGTGSSTGVGAGGEAGLVVVLRPGSPVRLGPRVSALVALLTCGHYLPVGRARVLLATMCGVRVSTGWVAGVRHRAAILLQDGFLPHLRDMLRTAPLLHADETCARAAGAVSYVHVACTEYLTVMHVGGRSGADIDAGGVLPDFTGTLMRDGYSGYTHLPAIHAWCAAHLLRDLRSLSDADPHTQLWALAMADTLLDAHQAADRARAVDATHLPDAVLTQIRSHYHGALARGAIDNHDQPGALATQARTLIRRFTRYEDMILRFATDLTTPFTNNTAERAIRPVKIQQRTSGGAWRTLQGLTDFAVVHSHLNTATKWGQDTLDVLYQLFTTGAWLPPALTPAE